MKNKINKKEGLRKKENYCVNNFIDVEFHNGLRDLIFENNCKIDTLCEGDGVTVNKKFVKFIGLNDEDNIEIILKGSNRSKKYYDKILWDCNE